MVEATSTISRTEIPYPANLLSFSSEKHFDDVVSDFEKLLGRFDEGKAIAAGGDLEAAVKKMQGPLELIVIGVLLMDQVVPSFKSSSIRVRQYQIGNPLILSSMTKHNTLAALYAPPRVLIYTQAGKTWISYDQPSSSLGWLGSDEITKTANDLDQKFETLATRALSVG